MGLYYRAYEQLTGAALHKALIVVSAVIIAATLALSREPVSKPLQPVTEWEPIERDKAEFSASVPKGWKCTDWIAGPMGLSTMVTYSPTTSILISRKMLPPGLDVRLGREGARDQAARRQHTAHLATLGKLLQNVRESTEMKWTSLQGASAVWSEFVAEKPGAFGGTGLKLRGRSVTGFTADNVYWIDVYGESEHWDSAMRDVADHVVDTFRTWKPRR